jgi:hypothetical protein
MPQTALEKLQIQNKNKTWRGKATTMVLKQYRKEQLKLALALSSHLKNGAPMRHRLPLCPWESEFP